MSNVPPPRSYTAIVSSFFLSSPYASEDAVGSLMMRRTSSPAILPASFVAWRWVSLKYAGTVMTACVTVSPRYASASCFIFCRIMAEISGGLYSLPPIDHAAVAVRRFDDFVGQTLERALHFGVVELAPHQPLDREDRVLRIGDGLAPRHLAHHPLVRLGLIATTDGNRREPSDVGMTTGSPPSITATTELVVPRSIPMILPIMMITPFDR